MLVSQILDRKGHDVATVDPSATITQVLDALASHGIGAVVVTADGEAVTGILSERDIVRSLARVGVSTVELTAGDLMTAAVFTCDIDATIEQLMSEMTSRRIRHVPVLTDGRLVGIVSIGDVVNARLHELQLETEHLTNYISGR